jgi:hypothetical protein
MQKLKNFLIFIIKKARIPFHFLLGLLFALHILAMLYETPPKRGNTTKIIHAYTSRYLQAVGTIQSWKMFISAPLVHRYQIKTVLTDRNGNELSLSPILPGFTETGRHFKDELFFVRTSKNKTWYLKQYLKRACIKAREAYGRDFVKARLVMDKEIITRPGDKNKIKEFTTTRTFEYQKTACDS